MRWLITIWRNLFHKQAMDTVLDEEIRSYWQLLEGERLLPALIRKPRGAK
jgi:hypothetical protein